MKDDIFYKLWNEFINDDKYKYYFLSQYDNFIFDLNKVKKYIDIHKQRPSTCSKIKDIKTMGSWISNNQLYYYKNIAIFKDDNIKTLWEEFINNEKYKEYFLSQYDKFIFDLNKVKNYIDINKKKPSYSNKDKTIKTMAHWISDSQCNYSKKKYNLSLENIRKLWEEFINDENYKLYF